MGFEIIDGRNHGYPCIPEQRECGEALASPVCEFMFVPGKVGYPVITRLSETASGLSEELPEYIMTSFGEHVNGGYPWIGGLKAAVNVSESHLYFGNRHVKVLYYEGKAIETAYCSGIRVFDTYLTREKIV